MAKNQSAGGILLPASMTAGAKQQTGTVVSVGPGKRNDAGVLIPIDLEKGQRVIISSWSGLEINDASASHTDEFVLLRDEDIQAILVD